MGLFSKIRTLRALGSGERSLILQALLLPALVQLSFHTIGVSRTQGRLRSWALKGRATGKPDQRLLTLARRGTSLGRRLLRSDGTCLVRSMSIWAVLLRRGITTELRVGFRKQDNQIQGHAWVEYQGTPVNEDPAVAGTYQIMPESAAYDLWASGDGTGKATSRTGA